ncbi:MAG: hypothetical protein RL148_1052 [Planctomycetota bacterium]
MPVRNPISLDALQRWCRGGALSWMVTALAALPAPAQTVEPVASLDRGVVALQQAILDAGEDRLALLVASHPDDRYVLPAAWLRFRHGARVAVLLATRGGGGQNSRGPETGDALERIRTRETETGCRALGIEAHYLDRPDGGYCRTAAEAFGEWGREDTLHALVVAIRKLKPDLVLTTHHAAEEHGHDLALVELLPEALRLAADPGFAPASGIVHRVPRALMGTPDGTESAPYAIRGDEVEPLRGLTYRRLAWNVLDQLHPSGGPAAPMESVLPPVSHFVPVPGWDDVAGKDLLDGIPGDWPPEFPLVAGAPDLLDQALAARAALQAEVPRDEDVRPTRRERRIEALDRVALAAAHVLVEVDTKPGAVAVPGEELELTLRVHNGSARELRLVGVEAVEGGLVTREAGEPLEQQVAAPAATLRIALRHRVPVAASSSADLMGPRFRGDRFHLPVRLRVVLATGNAQLTQLVDVPVELRAPVELTAVPPMLLLPTNRPSVQFTVDVLRNSAFPVQDALQVRAPAGYAIEADQRPLDLRTVHGDSHRFSVRAPVPNKGGVDVLRISLGSNRIALPVHKVDVAIDPDLHIGIVRGSDDTLPAVIGIGGLGLRWSELSDTDLAVRDLADFDTIVVDVRALRSRPQARRSFGRLLEFCRARGKRLLVFYHKDTEFHPPGEAFRGAPEEPFSVGKGRVTRADAPVVVLAPEHRLLTHPNRIRAADWDAWEQERGLYFPRLWAESYTPLLSMQDPGMPEERGALLHRAEPEGGDFVYCALALYRQLKKLHPGAVRLLANLLTPPDRKP